MTTISQEIADVFNRNMESKLSVDLAKGMAASVQEVVDAKVSEAANAYQGQIHALQQQIQTLTAPRPEAVDDVTARSVC